MGSLPAKGTYSASRCAAVLGLNPYQTPREIWQILMEELEPGWNAKHGYKLPEFQESAAIRWGHAFEEAVIKLAENKYDCKIVGREEFYSKTIIKKGCSVHPTTQIDDLGITLSCHIDGEFVPENWKLLAENKYTGMTLHEGKTCNSRAFHSIKEEKQRWGEPGTDQVPEEYQIQAAIQRICTGADLVRLSVLVFPKTTEEFEELGWETQEDGLINKMINEEDGICFDPEEWAINLEQMGFFHTYNLPSNPELEQAIIKKIQEFDRDHIKTGIPPDAKDYDDVRRLLTNPIGTVIATPELKQMASEYSEIVRQTGSAGPITKRKEQLKIEIMDKIMNTKKDDWSDPPDKVVLLDPEGGDVLASFSKSGFRAKRAR